MSKRLAKLCFVTKKLLQSRIIMVSEEITTQSAAITCGLLLLLDAENKQEDISMYLSSPGGEINAGLAIYDTMQLIKPDVVTICVGQTASTASMLLASGTRGKRHCTANSTVMVHQLSSSMSGQASDLESYIANVIKLKSLITRIYMKHCNKSHNEVNKTLDRDCFMQPQMALKWGLIDSVLGESV
ncbi:ATP-dependent Clp protease proteolytic subunit precursor [Candidatus Hodgkinia cicadicola]|nr:ATP-dependent Clp protease proteolytic subunit precursor [Candidatus Hodgkinia cicadicola]